MSLCRRQAARHASTSVLAAAEATTDAGPAPSAADAAAPAPAAESSSTNRRAAVPLDPPSAERLERNAALVSRLRGTVILAPLTKGGNLPFRRLCADFRAEVTFSEMGFARQLMRGEGKEKALLRRAANEACYGVQIATNQISEGIAAGKLAAEAGADFVDLNVGCPIYEATRRGLGSALLRKPAKLARLVAGIAAELPIPLTVKVRLGPAGDASINVQEVLEALRGAAPAAVTVHGRTAQQRYKKPADWEMISSLATQEGALPVIGNGDILTHYEARRRLEEHGVLAVMVGRGALIKPWIFQEALEGQAWEPTAAERVGVYRRLVAYMKEHFGEDDFGRRKAWYFLPWHLGFFSRYRPLPESAYGELSLRQPLISTRWEGVACLELGETPEGLPLLERLLRCESDAAHEAMAAVLWEAASDAEAVAALEGLAASELAGWEEEVKAGEGRDDRDRDSRREAEG